MSDRRDEIVETGIARFEAESEAAKMVQRYEQAIKQQQEANLRNETGPDCE
jgi:hypothetical protein